MRSKNAITSILIAEDSPTQAAQLTHLLERNGYEVTAARNGREALSLLEAITPALVITDVMMPELDGCGLCKALKSDERWKDIPVMLVTTLAGANDVIRGLECGADNFIRKPYDERYLLSRIEYLLMNRNLRRNQKMQMGVEINLGGQRHFITSERQQILDLLISTYEQAVQINEDLLARERDLADAIDVLNGLYRIAEGLNHSNSVQEVAERALERALELPGIEAGWIFLRQGEQLRVAAMRNVPPALASGGLESDCKCRRMLLEGTLTSVSNMTECERLQNSSGDTGGLRYHACVPLWLGDQTLGVMNLVGPQRGLFAEDELRVLYNIGNQVAVALDRARLHERLELLVEERTANLEAEVAERKRIEREVRRQARREHALAELGRVALSCPDVTSLLKAACRIVCNTLSAELVNVIELVPETDELVVREALGDGLPRGGTILGAAEGEHVRYVLGVESPAVVTDYAAETRFTPSPLLLDLGVVGGVSVVIASGPRPFGVLNALTRRPGAFSEGDVLFLQSLAHMAGATIERKQTEESLRRSQAMLQIAGRIARVGAWSVDASDFSVTFSDQCCAIHDLPPGYKPTVEEGLQWHAPEYRAMVTDAVERCLRDGTPFDIESQLITARGRRVWVRGIGEAERDANGAVRRLEGALQDITVRKEALEQSRVMAERLANTLETLSDAFLTFDREWRFTYLNREAERMLQRPREELVGQVLWDVFPDAAGSVFETEYRQAMEQDAGVTFEAFYPPFGIWVDARAYPSPQGLSVYLRDVTERRRALEDLQKSEERFRTLTEVMPQIVWMADPAGNNVYVNQRWTDYTGLVPEESHGPNWIAPWHPDDAGEALQAWQKAVATGGAYQLESRIRRHDGTYRWWLVRGVPVRDASGAITSWMGTLTDIHDLKEASARIAEQAALIDQAHDAITVRDLEHRILFWSKGAERVYGFRAQAVRGERFDRLLSIDPDVFAHAVESVLRDGEWNGEVEKLTASGEHVIVDARWTLLRDEHGRPRSILALDIDVTERKKAEVQLEESERRYRLLFDSNPYPSWVYDLETLAFLAVNDAAVRHYGFSREEFLGMTVRDIRRPGAVSESDDAPSSAAEGAEPRVSGVFRHRKRDGTIIEVEVASSEIEFGGRRAGLVLAIDVTERRRIEQQFLRAQRMESIGTLAGGIAHDLNNLLMPILMGATLLKRTDLRPEVLRKTVDNIEQSANRGRELVKQVLSFARGVEGSRVPIHVSDLFREIRSIIENTFPRNVSLEIQVEPGVWWVKGDPTELNQVMLNLCVNARDAMPAGGRLRLCARNLTIDRQYASMHRGMRVGRYVLIEVSDTGIGIPPEFLDRIFEPFFTTKEPGRGTGIGLSTLSAIVRGHAGHVEVHSDVGKGTTFKVYLPAETAVGDTPRAADPSEMPQGNGELILVVDDEPVILSITEQTLTASGYRAITAEDGAQAIALYAQHRDQVAVVVTDMMMPVMDGAALIAALRRINPDVRVIASSGVDDTGRTSRAARAGVKHFLLKPYSAEALLAKIHEVLQGNEAVVRVPSGIAE